MQSQSFSVVTPFEFKQVDFEKMSRHRIQWLLSCNLLSYFVCTFKNVTEGYIHAKNANMGGAVQSLYNASLPGYSYLSLFSISFLFCMGMATIQLRLRTWFGVLASCARHSGIRR